MTNLKQRVKDIEQQCINFQQAKNIANSETYSNSHYLFIDHVTKESFPTTTRKTQCLIIIYCKKGGIQYEYAGKTYRANKQDLIILNTKETFCCKKTYCGYEAIAILIADKDILSLPFNFLNFFQLKRNLGSKPIIGLSNQDCNSFTNYFYESIQLLNSSSYNEEKELHQNSRIIFNELIINHCDTYSYKQPQKDKEKEKKAIAFKKHIDRRFLVYKSLSLLLESFNNQQIQCRNKNSASCFKECFGISPTKYIYFLKICIAILELQKDGQTPIEKIAQKLSYTSPSIFCRTFKSAIGKSPHKFKNLKAEQQQSTIRHTIPFQIFALADFLETYTQEGSTPLLS